VAAVTDNEADAFLLDCTVQRMFFPWWATNGAIRDMLQMKSEEEGQVGGGGGGGGAAVVATVRRVFERWDGAAADVKEVGRSVFPICISSAFRNNYDEQCQTIEQFDRSNSDFHSNSSFSSTIGDKKKHLLAQLARTETLLKDALPLKSYLQRGVVLAYSSYPIHLPSPT